MHPLVFFSEKCKARGFTVIVDGRRSQWNIVKTVVLMLQVQMPPTRLRVYGVISVFNADFSVFFS